MFLLARDDFGEGARRSATVVSGRWRDGGAEPEG